ncbi:MAG: hypothetical protein ACT4OE_09745 [Sphingosinicella sp.]
MTEHRAISSAESGGNETRVAAVGTVASLTALFSATACCVLPLLLAGVGISAGGLSAFVPYRWPLTIAALIAVVAGWALYLQKRRACATDANCATARPSTTALTMLSVATVVVALCLIWDFIERPLLRAFGGA